jgi:DNA-binding transcriptional LysR family regulator
VELSELQVFLAVVTERSFSKAAALLNRTQPAVSQSVRRLEEELGEQLFDRSARGGQLTKAGTVLLDYARRLIRLKEEAETAVRELQDMREGRVLIGANEAAIHVLLPIVERFRTTHSLAQVEVTRTAARQLAAEVLNQSLDFGVLTFPPRDRGLRSLSLGQDDLVMLTHPSHPLARRRQINMEEFGRQTIIAHNDPSPARERVLRIYEQRHAAINIQIGLPSLDAIKHAIEMGLGVALLPRRCALAEIKRGQLSAVKVAQLGLPRDVRLIYRASGDMTRAAEAFLEAAREG